MESQNNQTDTLRKYAQERLEVHKSELETRYYDREPSSHELMEEAYQKQRQIFEEELSEKASELSGDDNNSAHSSLQELKSEFVEKLKPSTP